LPPHVPIENEIVLGPWRDPDADYSGHVAVEAAMRLRSAQTLGAVQ